MTKQLTDENNLKQIRKIEILKKRKRRLEKALILLTELTLTGKNLNLINLKKLMWEIK